jgi:hypothetical protein
VPVAVGFGNGTGAPAGYLYAIGREGFISRSLGKTHPTHGSP